MSNQDLKGIADFIRDEVPEKDKIKSPYQRDNQFNQLSKIKEEDQAAVKRSYTQYDTLNKKPTSKLAYGTQKRKPQNKGEEVVFQCKDLEKENLALKEKENLLERELTKMQVKLRRIDELMRSDKVFSDGNYASLQQDLEDQFREINDENDELKERVRKLRTIQKGLGSKEFQKQQPKQKKMRPGTSKAKTQSSKCEYHYSVIISFFFNHDFQPQRQEQVTKFSGDLRTQLVKIEKEILRLSNERDQLAQHSSGNSNIDNLLNQIKNKDAELREISKQFEDIEHGFVNKEQIFKESKAYMQEIMKEIRDKRIQNETLKHKNMNLQIRAQQSNNLHDQLRSLEAERDQIERSIRTMTSEPFFRREKGESTLQRIADLEERLMQKEKHHKAIQEEEYNKENELKDMRTNFEKLTGERDYLKNENEKLKGKFLDEFKGQDFNVYKTLFQMDPQKYADTIQDLRTQPDNIPAWADMDFLERGQEQIDDTNEKALKLEIMKLRHENKDFASELEKAQNLLKLQRDIEKDNSQYYEQERKRLDLLAKSSSLKAEELAKRADEKQRQIYEAEKRMSPSRAGSPEKSFGLNASQQFEQSEAQSEFSVMTNESDIRTDENVLDFVIQDAEYQYEGLQQLLDSRDLPYHQKSLITFATVDFYNHNTETSQIAEGFRPLYNTQFSFKNKVDDFYVQYLQKQNIRLDFYISMPGNKGNAAIHIGHAEVFLREIIERETAVSESSYKTPLIQKTIRVFPIGGSNQNQPLGYVRYKVRMRKPISEAMRFYREKNEINNISSKQSLGEGENKTRKKLVTIKIVKAHELKVKYSGVAKIAPFFYYQFYTYDERYSATCTGENPVFEDAQTYEVKFDSKFINYLQKEPLEIVLFDDNAPVTGVERAGKDISSEDQVDDMIGTAKIPLEDLIKGATVHEKFPIKNLRKENCGQLEVKLTIIDLDSGSMSIGQPQMNQMLSYNKQWENDIIYRIAKKLAKFPADVELLFGIFSRGQKTVTKEDFKYCVLQRLNLKHEISDKEMDLFLRGCSQLLDRDFIDKNDFVMIFSSAISQARHDLQNEEAMKMETVKRYEDVQQTMSQRQLEFDEFSRQSSPMKDYQTSRSNLNFNEQEVIDILKQIKQQGNVDQMFEKIRMYSIQDQIQSKDFIQALVVYGGISEMDAKKVAMFLEVSNKVKTSKFKDLFENSIKYTSSNSLGLRKFNELIMTKGEQLANQFLIRDYNKDERLNIDGFTAALLSQDFGFGKTEEIKEVFHILAQGEEFYYKDYLIRTNPNLKYFFTQRSQTQTPSQLLVSDSRQSIHESKQSLSHSSGQNQDPRLQQIKHKLKNYVTTNDITLSSLFQLIDTDSNQVLSLSEFIQKMKMLQVNLDDDELRVLFKTLDKTGAGSINYKQFVQEFPEINGSKVAPEMIFEKYCSDVNAGKMNHADFKKFVKFHHEKAAEHEIDSLYKHFDNTSKGFITKDEFKSAFGRDVKEQVFRISIEDIVKPLATKIQKYKVNVAQLFDKYDTSKNGRLSAEELKRALKQDQNIDLNDEEVQIIKEYFKNKHNSLEISKMDFITLMNTKFERHYDPEEAKQALQSIKMKLNNLNQTPNQVLSPYDTEKISKLTLRNFKHAINNLHVLNQYSIDNLAKYLDRENDGFISINEFVVAYQQVYATLTSTGTFSRSGRFTQKWK